MDYANVILEIGRKTRDIFYGFIIGKLIDSAIIGVICYVCMLIFRMPYPLLVSIIIGVTNIIPVFGPYIGAVPTVIIIFLTQPMQGIYFLIFVIVLQQIDGNIIGPKILPLVYLLSGLLLPLLSEVACLDLPECSLEYRQWHWFTI